MGSKGLFVAAIVCGTLGCVFLIAAVASTAWISGCMALDDLAKIAGNMGISAINGVSDSSPPSTPTDGDFSMNDGLGFLNGNGLSSLGGPSPEDGSENFPSDSVIPNMNLGSSIGNPMGGLSGAKLCASVGLFRISISMSVMMSIHTTIGMDFSTIPKAVIIGGVGIAIAVICSASAVIVLISAAAGNTDSYELKGKVSNRAGIGMTLLIIACVVGVVGMASYTGGSQQEIDNPAFIMMQLGSSFSNEFSQMRFGRGKRDLADLKSLSSLDDFGKMDAGGMDDIIKSVSSMFNFDLHYSRAFFLGWVACVFLIIGAIISAIAKQKLISQPYTGTNNIIL